MTFEYRFFIPFNSIPETYDIDYFLQVLSLNKIKSPEQRCDAYLIMNGKQNNESNYDYDNFGVKIRSFPHGKLEMKVREQRYENNGIEFWEKCFKKKSKLQNKKLDTNDILSIVTHVFEKYKKDHRVAQYLNLLNRNQENIVNIIVDKKRWQKSFPYFKNSISLELTECNCRYFKTQQQYLNDKETENNNKAIYNRYLSICLESSSFTTLEKYIETVFIPLIKSKFSNIRESISSPSNLMGYPEFLRKELYTTK
eukprot:gb/GECH01006438.1/.p1 GENE.gb/GECH01006438.1/~~gb/GECH01006438.1/.p1  ORF type:complete len:254 (+),score=69.34 gb/GECH01006438.1/:1-762(+)